MQVWPVPPKNPSRASNAPARLTKASKYLLGVLPFARPTTFCDVGANPINEPPYIGLLKAGACKVIGFEPNPAAFAELEKSKGPHETYFPHAVGDGDKHVLHLYRNSGLSSIYLPHLPGMTAIGNPGWARMNEDVEMQTVALDAIADLPPFDCLKIDIQGGEQIVFANGRLAMRNAVAVIVEMRWMQLYEGEPMAGGIDNELREQGFILHKFLFNKSTMLANSQAKRLNRRENLDQLVDGDAVYLRHPGKLEALSDDQLCHMAMLGASVIESHSLTVAALDELVKRGKIDRRIPARYVNALPEELRVPDAAIKDALTARKARRDEARGAEAAVAPAPQTETEDEPN